MAFLIIGVSPSGLTPLSRAWAQNVSIPPRRLVGTQRIYTVALWYWSSKVTIAEVGGVSTAILSSWRVAALVMLIATVCSAIGVLVALSLAGTTANLPVGLLL
ncbi:uncharacterized protein ATNIH1004_000832 [Aspergillus tanneri]|uniref:Cell wall alpha-1,3-glucan synthase Mok11-14/Ags1-like transmembrane domain-containing protein n=1 Tax=Aspergillus tanneri TaxID=1220188 RepID=A0A5M9N403_9EURO|nr:uncharacterized protein ATNIH1004_000832 [Aspergillus tanneri]KAA8651933.1 hypothetical protein ATNIH1004_000832 [Aspergillus tanneri]